MARSHGIAGLRGGPGPKGAMFFSLHIKLFWSFISKTKQAIFPLVDFFLCVIRTKIAPPPAASNGLPLFYFCLSVGPMEVTTDLPFRGPDLPPPQIFFACQFSGSLTPLLEFLESPLPNTLSEARFVDTIASCSVLVLYDSIDRSLLSQTDSSLIHYLISPSRANDIT